MMMMMMMAMTLGVGIHDSACANFDLTVLTPSGPALHIRNVSAQDDLVF